MSGLPVSRGVSRRFRLAAGIGAGVLALAVLAPLQKLLWQFFFSLALTGLAVPLSRRMEKHLSRPVSAGGAVILLVFFLLGLIGMLVPPMVTQIAMIIAEAPRMIAKLMEIWEQWSRSDFARMLDMDAGGPSAWLNSAAKWAGDSLPGLLSGIGTGADAVSRAFLSPVLAFYFVRDRETFAYQLSLWIPTKHRKRILTVWQEMRREAGGYFRGQMLVALAVAALTSLGLLAAGIPAWLALGLIMGICEWIPYIGPLIGGIPIVLFSLPLGLDTMLWGLGITVFVQQVEGYFLSPRLMSGTTGLHPVYVLLLLSAGSLLWGLPGMVAAVPAFVCVRGAVRVLYETRA